MVLGALVFFYNETRVKVKTDKTIYKTLLKFSGWSSLSYIAKIMSDQGIILILNIFGGTVVNAAYGIANQVNGQMNYFSTSLLQAIEPQIMKSEGAGNRDRMLRLSILTCKLSFFLISFFSIPIIVKLPYILEIWLKNVPEYTVIFCKIILIATIINQITIGLQSGIYAKGDIKHFQFIISCLQILTLPLSLVFIKLGFPIYAITYSLIAVELIIFIARIYFAKNYIELQIYTFIKRIIIPSIFSFIACYLSIEYISTKIANNFGGLVLICICSFTIYLILFWSITINKEEKTAIKNIVDFVFSKFKKK